MAKKKLNEAPPIDYGDGRERMSPDIERKLKSSKKERERYIDKFIKPISVEIDKISTELKVSYREKIAGIRAGITSKSIAQLYTRRLQLYVEAGQRGGFNYMCTDIIKFLALRM